MLISDWRQYKQFQHEQARRKEEQRKEEERQEKSWQQKLKRGFRRDKSDDNTASHVPWMSSWDPTILA